MQTDPSKWLVSFAGFAYDWIITREWAKILLAAFPIYILLAVVGLVFWGSQGSQLELAKWYLELGNEEIAEWEDSWAPSADAEDDIDADLGVAEDSDDAEVEESPQESDPLGDERPSVSPFAETLFRKVQLLEPSDRSQYIIGTTLAQKGAIAQAEQLLTKIAPDEGSAGYAPAHLILTELYIQRFREDPRKYLPLIMHHYKQAAKWSRIPTQHLTRAASLFAEQNRINEAIQFQTLAADRDPAMNSQLARLAIAAGNVKLAERARRTGERYFLQELESDPQNIGFRIKLADIYRETNKIDQAAKWLFEGLEGVEPTPELRRAQSQYFILKFQRSVKVRGTEARIELGFLDKAMRLDPSNPNVAEQVAGLAAAGVQGASDDLIDALRKFLAEGKATIGTHRLLAQIYATRGDLKKAMGHYEQIVVRLPTSADAQNNLAYCLAVEFPSRLDEALKHSEMAIKLNSSQRDRNPDYFDTYSMILDKLGRDTEAIASIETAIELAPKRVDFHVRAADLYKKTGNEEMESMHRTQAETLKMSQADVK